MDQDYCNLSSESNFYSVVRKAGLNFVIKCRFAIHTFSRALPLPFLSLTRTFRDNVHNERFEVDPSRLHTFTEVTVSEVHLYVNIFKVLLSDELVQLILRAGRRRNQWWCSSTEGDGVTTVAMACHAARGESEDV